MFFYREPEEAKEEGEEGAAEFTEGYAAQQLPGAEEGYDAYGAWAGPGRAALTDGSCWWNLVDDDGS